ncbi:S-layer homology domain-containing protein [Candidatus Gracilibacteria bacterium]|nr:S-layer homology domain-containing protein [Candidatus Gracilibacteria bacterium]
MDFLRKSLASITLSALAATLFVAPAQAALDFTDEGEIPSWAEEAVEELMDQGVISGNDDGSFAPNRQLNRAEVSKIIVLSTGIDLDTTGGPHFPDVEESAWYYDYIETMYNQNWINGYPDGLFRPGVGINRAEIAKMIVNAFEIDQDLSGAPHFDDVSESDWFYGYVETAYNNGLMRGYGDGTFGSANAVTRAETVKIVYDSQLVVISPMGPAEGTLEVVLSRATPRGTNIPFNATSVPFTTFELTASDDADVEISSLTFTRLGLGDNDDFDNVWMEIDGFKVGNDKSINNDDVVELRFNPPLVIPAGQTLMADVVASTKYAAADHNVGHHNRLALVSADDMVTTAANIAGDFPIEGEEMEVAEYEVSQIKFSRLGSDTTVDVGDNFIEIGKFRMLNASNTNKDVELRALTLKNDGTAEIEDNLENVALYISGEQVSAETIIDGDYVTFRLDNGVTGGYIIEDGDSRIFSIRADIVSAEKNDTINFKIDNFEDVVGVEIGTAFGVKALSADALGLDFASGTTTTNATVCTDKNAEDGCARLKAYTIDSGDLNISRDPASLGNQEYAPGSNDIVFLTARLVVDQPLIVDGVRIDVASNVGIILGTAGADHELGTTFDNFRLFLNDNLIDSENTFANIATAVNDGYLNFNTTFEIAGTSILKVVGNLRDGAKTGDSIKLEIINAAFASPEYISTGDQVSSTEVLGSAQGSFVEIRESTLTIAKTDGLTSGDKIVAGVDDITFLKFVLDNNDSGDVNVTSATIEGTATGNARTYSNFTAAVFVGGQQQGSSKNLSTLGVATFNDLSVVIPSAGQTEFEVVVDTIEASATAVEQNAVAAVANTSVTISAANAALLTVGDKLKVTEKVDPGTAAGTLTETARELLSTAINTTTGVITTTGTVAVQGAAVVGTAGESDFDITTAFVTTDVVTLANGAGNICVVTFTDNVAGGDDSVYSCATGAVIDSNFIVSAADQNDAIFALTNLLDAGYTLTQPGVAGTLVTFAETATPYIVGNVTATVAGGSTGRINATGAVGLQTAGAGNTVGVATETAHLVSLKNEMDLQVTAVDADNVENGQTVTVTTLPLAGVSFELVQSGRLTATVGSTVYSDLLVANATDVEVLKIRFNAADDEVQVKDVYLKNNLAGTPAFSDRANFKLYNDAGQLIQEKQMTGGTLHFELANQDRIRVPRDDSTTVTVKVDIRDITKANQTGARLDLALDTTAASPAVEGLEAVTAATGTDLDSIAIDGTTATPDGEPFVAYRTQISVNHAASQPAFADPSAASQEVYRFTVTADAARQAEIGRVSLKVDLSGMDFDGGNTFAVKQVKDDGTIDNTATVTTAVTNTENSDLTTVDTVDDGDVTAYVLIDFSNQKLDAGESRTYALFFDLTTNAGGAADDDSVSVTIVTDTTYRAPEGRTAVEGDANNDGASTDNSALVWSDESSTVHSSTSLDWLNGYLVDTDTTANINQD